MKDRAGFYTLKGYLKQDNNLLTNAMEDYLEMIVRLARNGVEIHVNELAKNLHVKAPSVTKMVQQLAQEGYVHAERYGMISLTRKGRCTGNYLLHRHEVLQEFLCTVNQTDSELEQVEKIEHFLDKRTINNLELLTKQLQKGIIPRD